MSIIIKHCGIIGMTGYDDYINDGYILIDDDTIRYVGSESPSISDGDYIIDGRRSVALPGFINTHTHCSMTLLRGYGEGLPLMRWLNEKIWPFEAKLTGEDIFLGAQLASVEMTKSGTTCFLDMYYNEEDVCRAVGEAGIRAVLGSPIIGDSWEKQIKDFNNFFDTYDGIFNNRIKAMIAPHAPYTCSFNALSETANAAKSLGCGVHIHLSETEDEVKNILNQYSMTPVEFIENAGILDAVNVVAAHCVHLNDSDINILKNHNVNAAHCPQSNMKLASGVSPVWSMLQEGINVSLGTDGASSNNNLDMIEEMQTASYLQKLYQKDATALPPYSCLEMATTNGAKALGLDNEIGCIKPGMKADIILIDMNNPVMVPCFDPYSNLIYSGSGRDVKTVIVNGSILMENYQLKALDEEKIMYDAQKAVEDILKR